MAERMGEYIGANEMSDIAGVYEAYWNEVWRVSPSFLALL